MVLWGYNSEQAEALARCQLDIDNYTHFAALKAGGKVVAWGEEVGNQMFHVFFTFGRVWSNGCFRLFSDAFGHVWTFS